MKRRISGMDDEPALAGLVHDIDFTRFDNRVGRLAALALAAVVAFVAADRGIQAAMVVAFAIGLALALTVVAVERDRWQAQDVFQWYQRARLDRWRRDTHGDSPGGDPAAAEVWLGTHQRGSVPQLYRALAAHHTGDPVVIQREVSAMPSRTPADLAWQEWLDQTTRFNLTGTADPRNLARLIEDLPPSADRQAFQSWIATVESARRRLAGDRDWIEPLASARATAERTPLGIRRRARIWLSRFAIIIVFAVPAALFSSIALTIAEQPRPDYADTTFSGRGQWPVDPDGAFSAIAGHARSLERAVAQATRLAGPLDEDSFSRDIDSGAPTLIWTVGKISFSAPPDAAGRKVWEVEVLLGAFGGRESVIVTFDGPTGPRYGYRIDPMVLRQLRADVGLSAGG